jgi:hypothetical protein
VGVDQHLVVAVGGDDRQRRVELRAIVRHIAHEVRRLARPQRPPGLAQIQGVEVDPGVGEIVG